MSGKKREQERSFTLEQLRNDRPAVVRAAKIAPVAVTNAAGERRFTLSIPDGQAE